MSTEKRKKAYDFSDISRGYKDETSSRRFMYFKFTSCAQKARTQAITAEYILT